MRVIAGTARSLRLKTLEGMETRPTTDRIKETVFNMLQNDIQGSSFLDLFSGSGAIGIEALSRGARSAVFVDNNREAIKCIEENLNHTKFTNQARVISSESVTALRRMEGKDHFDIIFMDPPYEKELEREVLECLLNSDILTEDTIIIIEASKETTFDYLDDLGYICTKEKMYKTNKHVFLCRKDL